MKPLLFTPWELREVHLRNRIGVSPMRWPMPGAKAAPCARGKVVVL
jgi:2,4-dienoyl-CoA reductase-like NADH-dependent reductase (Old Yellow Enzyme family)